MEKGAGIMEGIPMLILSVGSICSAWHVDECSGSMTETRATCQKITYYCNGCGYELEKDGFFDEHHSYAGGYCEYCGETDPNGESTEPPDETEPPTTDPPETEPPETEPPKTEPPTTEPPATEPPQTDPPATDPPPEPETDPQPEEGGGDPGGETT